MVASAMSLLPGLIGRIGGGLVALSSRHRDRNSNMR
jgi:hypothetical protein